MSNFVFDDIRDGHTAKLGDYWYFFDDKRGLITFKTKKPNELLDYNYLKFVVDKTVYITDLYGNVKLETKEETLSYDIKQLPEFNHKAETLTNTELCETQINIGLKQYKYLFSFYFDETVYICAKNPETNLCGIVDTNENIVIPFMYDEIYDWNIDTWYKTIMAVYQGKCGIIDINNNILLPFKYKYIFGFPDIENDYSFVQNMQGKWGIIDRQGNAVEINLDKIPEFSRVYHYSTSMKGYNQSKG